MSSNVSFRSVPYDPDMNPRDIWESRNGRNATQKKENKSVIVKVNNLDEWKQLNIPFTIISSHPNEWILTTHISSDQIKSIKGQPFVEQLEVGRMVHLVAEES